MPDQPSTDPSDATKEFPDTKVRLHALERDVSEIKRILHGDKITDYVGLKEQVKDLKDGKLTKILTWSRAGTLIISVATVVYLTLEIADHFSK